MVPEDGNLTYQSYLHLSELLSLQRPRTNCEAEPLFIGVHQCVEILWNVALGLNDRIMKAMESSDTDELARKIRRVAAVIKKSTEVAMLLKLMLPDEFAEFRIELGEASGLQSNQFRELELQAGLDGSSFLQSYAQDSWEYQSVKARLDGSHLRASFFKMIERFGLNLVGEKSRIAPGRTTTDGSVTDAIRRIYSEPRFRNLAEIADALHAYDDAFATFRWEHFQLVQRIIGRSLGTAGKSNSYLEEKLLSRFFPELIAVRS